MQHQFLRAWEEAVMMYGYGWSDGMVFGPTHWITFIAPGRSGAVPPWPHPEQNWPFPALVGAGVGARRQSGGVVGFGSI
jgi:hypothetical protein